MKLEFLRGEEKTAVVLPANLGDILWYIHEGKICSARVFEMKITIADAGYCCEDVIAFAWNPKAFRQLTWCPLHGEGWLDARNQYVPVFTTREEADAALRQSREGVTENDPV